MHPGDGVEPPRPSPLPRPPAANSEPREASADGETPLGEVTGRVLGRDGQGLGGVIVQASREDGPPTNRETTTQTDGTFVLTGLPAGRWLVRATAPGLATAAVLQHVPAAAPLDLVLAPLGRITGRVLGLDGLPTQAEIVLAGSGVWPARSTWAGTDGHFVFEAVPPGVYEVQARSVHGAAEPRRGLLVEAGGMIHLTFHLDRGETLAGTVSDAETERPISGAQIVVTQEALAAAPRAVQSDANGRFRVAGLRRTPHRVSVHAEGYVPVVARTWTPGTALTIALEPGATLSGVVLDARRRPVEGARVEVTGEGTDLQPVAIGAISREVRDELFRAHADGLARLEVTGDVPPLPLETSPATDAARALATAPAATWPNASVLLTRADGRFRVTGVPPGHVHIVARADGHAPGNSERLWVAPGGSRENIEIVLRPAGRIVGTLVDETGVPVAGVPVEHRSEAEPWARIAVTDEAGTFAFDDVAGAVTLRAIPPGRATAQVRLDVAAGALVQARLQLPASGPTIAGRAVDRRGRPIARAHVRLESMAPAETAPRVSFTDEDGRFTFENAPPGPWQLVADHPDYASSEPVDLEVPPSAAAPLVIVLADATMITGRVVDPFRGEGVAEAEVWLERSSGAPVLRRARTDATGAFVIPRAAAGAYVVRVAAAGYAPWERAVEVPRGRDGSFEMEPIELEAGATLEGDVVDALGRVLRGVEVAVEGDPTRTVRTDARGHFALPGLAAGPVVIRARHPAAGEVSRSITVPRLRDPAPVVLRLDARYDPERPADDRGIVHGVAAELRQDDAGIVMLPEPGSAAWRAGLRQGDVLLAVDGEPVPDLETAARLLRGPEGAAAVLEVQRGDTVFRVRVPRETW